MTKVIVGISGGVDSSVSAYLLKQQGFEVHGVFMKNWEADDNDQYCTAEQDLSDAQSVCAKLQIPLEVVNFSSEYWDRVFQFFLDEYRAGRTPNPDILCNKEIKFRAFLDYAKRAGADYIATGHYARRDELAGRVRLLKGTDREKDQSYFLHLLNQEQLRSSLFPVGECQKTKVREIALEQGLITHDKKDSTGICFIGERKFSEFLREYLLTQPGPIKTTDGRVLGEHAGLMYFTLGQRQGLQIGGLKEAKEGAWYVLEKDIPNNALIVGQGAEHPRLYAQGLVCQEIHWISGDPPQYPLQCAAKIRYRQADQHCLVSPSEDGRHSIWFVDKQRAITPGQSIVFYQSNECLGGAIIESIIY